MRREQELTRLRPTTPAEEFRALADEFDARVERIRSEQDEKARTQKDAGWGDPPRPRESTSGEALTLWHNLGTLP